MIGNTPATAGRPILVGASGLYVTGDDYLLLSSLNTQGSSARVTIGGRVLSLDGRPIPFTDRHAPANDRTITSSVIRLGEGWLQEITVATAGGSGGYGRTWVRVDMCRGDGSGREVLGTLVQGYVTNTQRRGWPGSPLEAAQDRVGALREFTGTNPAAGVEITETVPTGARWRLLALRATLVTDATVANREPSLRLTIGGLLVASIPVGAAQAASVTRAYTFVPVSVRAAAGVSGDTIVPIPDLWLPPGATITTSTAAIVAGDDWSAPIYQVEEQFDAA